MISVAIFWVGAGHIAYLWVLPSLFHVFFAILIMLYYFLWIQKKNFSVFPKRFTSRVANAKIYKKLYEFFIIIPKKEKKMSTILYSATISLLIAYAFGYPFFLKKPKVDLKDMQKFYGRYEDISILGNRNYCGRYIITFSQDNGSAINFYATLDRGIIESIKSSNEFFTLWAMKSKMAECRSYLKLKQVIGSQVKYKYNPHRHKLANNFRRRFLLLFSALSAFLYIYAYLTSRRLSRTIQ